MKTGKVAVWAPIVALSLLLTGCPPGPQPLQTLSVGIDIRGGNTDHVAFEAELTLTLKNQEVQIVGTIAYVEFPPTRLAIRDGLFWEHHRAPGTIVASYALTGENYGPVDVGGSLTLTEEQARRLREGRYYIDVDTPYAALGPIAPSDAVRAASGKLHIVTEGLPTDETVWLRTLADYPYPSLGPGTYVSNGGTQLSDLMYGDYGFNSPVYEIGEVDYVGVVTPSTVRIDDGTVATVTVVFTGVPGGE